MTDWINVLIGVTTTLAGLVLLAIFIELTATGWLEWKTRNQEDDPDDNF